MIAPELPSCTGVSCCSIHWLESRSAESLKPSPSWFSGGPSIVNKVDGEMAWASNYRGAYLQLPKAEFCVA